MVEPIRGAGGTGGNSYGRGRSLPLRLHRHLCSTLQLEGMVVPAVADHPHTVIPITITLQYSHLPHSYSVHTCDVHICHIHTRNVHTCSVVGYTVPLRPIQLSMKKPSELTSWLGTPAHQ